MKLTIETLEAEGIEIAWFDVKDEGGLSFQGGRTLADQRNSRMFILGSVIVEHTSPATITFVPLSSVLNGWCK